MFGRKNKLKERDAAKAKLAKKILGKDSGRRVFGFPCSPDIPAQLKLLADQLNVPLYALCEHALQLSANQVAKAVANPEEITLLRKHLTEIHIEARTIEKISSYDRDMGEQLERERLRRLGIEQAVRQIVVDFIRGGLRPQEISWCIDYGMRCRIAVAQGKPVPTDLPRDV
jgi:hypothetical protein